MAAVKAKQDAKKAKADKAAAENSKKADKANDEGDLLILEEIAQSKPYRTKQPMVRYADGCDNLFLYLIIINFDYSMYLSIQSHTRIKKLTLKQS